MWKFIFFILIFFKFFNSRKVIVNQFKVFSYLVTYLHKNIIFMPFTFNNQLSLKYFFLRIDSFDIYFWFAFHEPLVFYFIPFFLFFSKNNFFFLNKFENYSFSKSFLNVNFNFFIFYNFYNKTMVLILNF
jgi:hypothetical protein